MKSKTGALLVAATRVVDSHDDPAPTPPSMIPAPELTPNPAAKYPGPPASVPGC